MLIVSSESEGDCCWYALLLSMGGACGIPKCWSAESLLSARLDLASALEVDALNIISANRRPVPIIETYKIDENDGVRF